VIDALLIARQMNGATLLCAAAEDATEVKK
jgi:hypothetical protein